jgi:GNAT superfamily N-acetyltransferase
MGHTPWQERCSLALSLQSRAQRDDFGGFVEPSMKMLLAAGMSRIAHKDGLSNVVVASTDAQVARWLQPSWQVTLDATGAPTLLHNPQSVPAGGPRPAAEVIITYDADEFDSGGAAPSVDPVLERARSHGATATSTSSIVPGPYQRGTREVVSSVIIDAATVKACEVTGLATSDVSQDRECSTSYVVPLELTDGAWLGVAVVLGASGSGKTLALMAATGSSRRPVQAQWSEDESVASVIAGLGALTVPAALDALQLIGLGPSASSRSHAALSAGERCLADIAHAVASTRGGDAAGDVIAIDEFTSVLDRSAAAVACVGLPRLMQQLGVKSRLVVATVHEDVVPWLKPQLLVLTSHRKVHCLDWTDAAPPHPPPAWSDSGADPFARPQLRLKLRTARNYHYAKDLWRKIFEEHHYMDGDLHTTAVVDVLRLEETNEPVGFIATISKWGKVDTKDKAAHEQSRMRREHRVVVLPSCQGLGLGPALSNESAALWTATTHDDEVKTERPHWRYMSTTSHPRFGSYRNANNEWAPTSGNGKDGRYSHEYVGLPAIGVRRLAPSSKRPRPTSSQPTMMQAFSRSSTLQGLGASTSGTGSRADDAICVG